MKPISLAYCFRLVQYIQKCLIFVILTREHPHVNIFVRVPSFQLKLWGISSAYNTYLWTKFQLEIRLFRLSANSIPLARKSSKTLISQQENIGKPNQNRLFHYSSRPIKWQQSQSKSDWTVEMFPRQYHENETFLYIQNKSKTTSQ